MALKNEKDDFYYNNDWQNEKNELQSEIWKLNVEIARLEAEIEQCQEELENLTAQQKDLYNELNRMTRWHAEYKIQTLKIKKIDSYLKTLNDYKGKYRNNKITKLEQNINYMFNLLSSKSKFDWVINWCFEYDPSKIDESLYDCKVNINKDTFKVNISYGQSAVRRSWWEETILAISIIWWLSKTSSIDLPIVIDAPVSLLDEMHTNNVFKHYFPKAAKQVIILIKDRDMMPWSEWYNSLKDYISKEYTLVFNTDTRDSKVIEWYNF
jgi:DNA sulfur modification protein DndD